MLDFREEVPPGLKYDFEKYAPTPYGFCVAETFDKHDDNQRVVSKIYKRLFDIPRTLEIPGNMWSYSGCKSQSVRLSSGTYTCVIKAVEPQTGSHVLYCVDDDTDDIVFNRKFTDADFRSWQSVYDIHLCKKGASHPVARLKRLRDELEEQHASMLTHIDAAIEEFTLPVNSAAQWMDCALNLPQKQKKCIVAVSAESRRKTMCANGCNKQKAMA